MASHFNPGAAGHSVLDRPGLRGKVLALVDALRGGRRSGASEAEFGRVQLSSGLED